MARKTSDRSLLLAAVALGGLLFCAAISKCVELLGREPPAPASARSAPDIDGGGDEGQRPGVQNTSAPPSDPFAGACKLEGPRKFTILHEEHANIPGAPRLVVKVRVPPGLSADQLQANLCVAAASAYKPGLGAMMVWGYHTDDIDHGYTAGRLTWAPEGNWAKADPSVPLPKWKIVVDLQETYFATHAAVGAQVVLADSTGPTVSVSRKFESWGDADILARVKNGTTAKLLSVKTFGVITRYEVQLPDGRKGWVHDTDAEPGP